MSITRCINEGCVKGTDPTKLLNCSRCKTAKYCDIECQRQDWIRRHKDKCRTLQSVFLNLTKKKLPKYDEEYKKAYPSDGLFYQHINKSRRFATDVITIYHTMPHCQIDLERSGINSFQRWGLNFLDPKFKAFVAKGPSVGQIGPWVDSRYLAGDLLFQTMRNNFIDDLKIRMGDTIVMIGFFDLHQLIMSTLDGPEPTNFTNPVKLIAIDMSSVCIAKSLVVHSMMMENCRSKSILQVMFSSAWDEETLLEFCMCCAKVELKYLNEPILDSILQTWQETRINLSEGIDNWKKFQSYQSGRNNVFNQMSFLANEKDRVEYARYLSNGIVFVSEKDAQYGNPTVVDPPNPNPSKRMENENIYDTISPGTQLNRHGTILEALEEKLTNKTNDLKRRLIKGHIDCEFLLCEVSASNKALSQLIKGKRPDIVYWSNCLDYLLPEHAYEIITDISNVETEHVALFMNWRKLVFGSTFVDYSASKDLLPLLEESHQEYAAFAETRPRFLPAAEAPLLLNSINEIDRQLGKKFFSVFLSVYLDNESFKIISTKYSDFSIFGRVGNCFTVRFALK